MPWWFIFATPLGVIGASVALIAMGAGFGWLIWG